MNKPKVDSGALVSGLKDQLALLSFIVLFAGLVSTDTYYAGFGLRYQLLNLSVQHLTYRGISAVSENFTLAAAYLVAVAWLALHPLVGKRWPRLEPWMQASTYGVVVVAIVVAYLTAVSAGRIAAEADLDSKRSTLPLVQSMKGANGEDLPYQGYRILLADKDRVVIFKPATQPGELPFEHLMRGDDVGEIVFTP